MSTHASGTSVRIALACLLGLGACSTNNHPSRSDVLAEAMARFDADDNGYIEPNEYPAYHPVEQGFTDLDTNGDKRIGPEEMEAFLVNTKPREGWRSRGERDRERGDGPIPSEEIDDNPLPDAEE